SYHGQHLSLPSFPTRRSSDLLPALPYPAREHCERDGRNGGRPIAAQARSGVRLIFPEATHWRSVHAKFHRRLLHLSATALSADRSEEHTSELESQSNLVCRLL